jgi:hypothetical protein
MAMRALLASVLLLSAACAACAAPATEGDDAESSEDAITQDLRPELAQVNDVSILLPLAKTKASFDRGYLTPGAMLPKAVYERAFGPPGTLQVGGTPAAPALAGLRLVAVRFDPCFANSNPCKNQMRLIFQTLTFAGSKTTAADDAVHVFYSLTRDELKGAVKKMIDLRQRKAGERRLGALGPHPLLKAASGDLDVAVAGEVNAIVTSLAKADKLVQFTQFAPSGLDTTWNFSGFDVEKSAAMKIPSLPANDDTHVAFFAGFTPGQLEGDPAFVPASTAPPADNVQDLGNRARADAAGTAGRARAFAALNRLENPTLHTPDTTDCASCHAVEPVRKLIGTKHYASEMAAAKADTFAADETYVPKADIAAPDAADSGINVHMFSYKGTTPSVHRRTINESAAIVAELNARILR